MRILSSARFETQSVRILPDYGTSAQTGLPSAAPISNPREAGPTRNPADLRKIQPVRNLHRKGDKFVLAAVAVSFRHRPNPRNKCKVGTPSPTADRPRFLAASVVTRVPREGAALSPEARSAIGQLAATAKRHEEAGRDIDRRLAEMAARQQHHDEALERRDAVVKANTEAGATLTLTMNRLGNIVIRHEERLDDIEGNAR